MELTPQARQALEAEAVLRKTNLKDLASEFILISVSDESLKFVGAERPNNKRAEHPTVPMLSVTDSEQKKPKLSENPYALARMKELWASESRPSIGKIAKDIGYAKSTVDDYIKKLIKAGELQKRLDE